jgi:hypothetical protein
MSAWSPMSEHLYLETAAITEARYQAIAADIATAAEDPAEAPFFAGDDGRVRTAVLLAAVASFESGGFVAAVVDCRKPGDHGGAWGLYQSHRDRRMACAGVESASHLALAQFRESVRACQQLPPALWLSAYASGRCSSGHDASRQRWARASAWMLAHPWVAP